MSIGLPINAITSKIIGASIKVHRELGPGLLESVYEEVLSHELREEGLMVSRQEPVKIIYGETVFDKAFRADLIVAKKVLVELKSVEKIHDVHKKTVLTYLRLSGLSIGLLINFNEAVLKNGITRIVNGYQEKP